MTAAAAADIELRIEDPASPAAAACFAAYFAELATRFESGFDPARTAQVGAPELTPPRGLFVLAWHGDEPVGCGGLRFRPGEITEIKRMWISPAVRGRGLGRRLLADLEARARERGDRVLRLDSNRALEAAIALYRAAGYLEIPAFNSEPYAHIWFEKCL